MIRKKRILRVRLLYVVLAVLLIAIAAILIVYYRKADWAGQTQKTAKQKTQA